MHVVPVVYVLQRGGTLQLSSEVNWMTVCASLTRSLVSARKLWNSSASARTAFLEEALC